MEKLVHEMRTKKISISEVKPGMVLAKDLFDPKGFILLSRDTIITEYNSRKLVEKNIKEIYIKEAVFNIEKDDEDERSTQGGSAVKKLAETKAFKEFELGYVENLEASKEKLSDISEGEDIRIKELFELTNSIMGKLKAKSDVLTYISFLKVHDEYTFSHSSNVAMLCNLFAFWLKLDEVSTMNLTAAGLLHDIGKLKMPLEILNKKGKLTESEYSIIKEHTTIGYRLIQSQNIPDDIKLAALMHHERIDGSGYPMGFKDKQINECAKIIAICDIYDAMISNRIYRGRICPFEVIKQFEVSSLGELDTQFLLVFLKNIAYTYFGSNVRLSDGRIGEVVYIHPNNLSRPVVKVGDTMIDTQKALEITVAEVL